MLPDFEVFREGLQCPCLHLSGHVPVRISNGVAGGFHQATVPGFDAPVGDRGVGDHFKLGGFPPNLLAEQDSRPGVPGGGVEHDAPVQGHGAALALDQHVTLDLVFKVLAGRTVGGAQVTVVGHVIQHFLGMDIEFREVVELPVNPAALIPLLQIGCGIIRFGAVLIKPHHDAAHVVHYGIGSNGS